jgi:hypothetical protein
LILFARESTESDPQSSREASFRRLSQTESRKASACATTTTGTKHKKNVAFSCYRESTKHVFLHATGENASQRLVFTSWTRRILTNTLDFIHTQ